MQPINCLVLSAKGGAEGVFAVLRHCLVSRRCNVVFCCNMLAQVLQCCCVRYRRDWGLMHDPILTTHNYFVGIILVDERHPYA